MKRVRPAVVEERDRIVGREVTPIGRPALAAVATARIGDGILVAAGDRDEARDERRRLRPLLELAIRIRMRLAHEHVVEIPTPISRTAPAGALIGRNAAWLRRTRSRKERSPCDG